NILKKVLFGFFIIVLVLTGCAHQPVADSSAKKNLSANDTEALNSESGNTEDEDLDFLYEEAEEGVSDVADPIAPWNKAMFHFNDKLYFWVLKPVAIGYKTVMPTPARKGVKNFFHNLQTPPRLVNALLQGKGKGAWSEFARFMVNSTIGVLGFWDPAEEHLKLKPCEEDLGQTLGFYGVGNGFYIVWPVLGSSTLRDTFGSIGDSFLDPVMYIEPAEASLGARSLLLINTTSLTLGDYESFKDDYYSPYEAFRNSYIQYRKNKVEK
ncbi:MAG: VacJ family lipoprotein, partial [Deltaproteobacteria bacterium]|nr:VacJ family lipoprotein [Deltaproteobacteria bacterium]